MGPGAPDLIKIAPPVKKRLRFREVDETEEELIKECLWKCEDYSSDRNSQDWALVLLKRLRAKGLVDEMYTEAFIRNWLRDT
jgi:hypothetical protein